MRIISSACAAAAPTDPSAMATSSATRRAVLDCNTRYILLYSSRDAKLSWANCRRARRSRHRCSPHVDSWDRSQLIAPHGPTNTVALGLRPSASIASTPARPSPDPPAPPHHIVVPRGPRGRQSQFGLLLVA